MIKQPAILFADDFYQDAFFTPAVEFPVKELFPCAKIKLAVCHRHDHFAPHHLALHVRVRVVFTGVVMTILIDRFVGGEPFQPFFIIVVQPAFIVVDEDGGGDVHGIDEAESLADAAFTQTLFHLRCDVCKTAAGREVEPEFFAVGFHGWNDAGTEFFLPKSYNIFLAKRSLDSFRKIMRADGFRDEVQCARVERVSFTADIIQGGDHDYGYAS